MSRSLHTVSVVCGCEVPVHIEGGINPDGVTYGAYDVMATCVVQHEITVIRFRDPNREPLVSEPDDRCVGGHKISGIDLDRLRVTALALARDEPFSAEEYD